MSKLWSGDTLAQKDAERKKQKASRIMMSEPNDDAPASAWFDEDAGLEIEDTLAEIEEVESRFDEAAFALAEQPTDPECLANFQEAKNQKMR